MLDWVVAAVQDAWPGVLVTTEPVPADPAAPFASVRLGRIGFGPDCSRSDEAELGFVLVGRFEAGTGSVTEAIVTRTSALRDALSVLGGVGGGGYLPQLSAVSLVDPRPGDGEFELKFEFVCRLTAGRV